MKKAVEYLRISQPRKDKNNKKTDDELYAEELENQRIKNREFAKSKGIEIVESFEDPYVSGAVPMRKRSGYLRMLDYCEQNNIKIIITYDISRISRGDFVDGLIELKTLTDEGYTVYFSSQQFLHEIDDPLMRQKILTDFLWFAQLYREDIRRKTKQGIERARAEGKHIGRPYREINWKQVKRWREKGLSWSAISRIMDIPYSTLIRRKDELNKPL